MPPLYEYQCTNCRLKVEVIQKISDEPLKTCEHCHTDNMKKMLTSASLVFKGEGFYENDSKNK